MTIGLCTPRPCLTCRRLPPFHCAEMADWQAAIAAEGRELQRRGATPEALEDDSLRHTRAAVCETLRLRPPAWAFDREVHR